MIVPLSMSVTCI